MWPAETQLKTTLYGDDWSVVYAPLERHAISGSKYARTRRTVLTEICVRLHCRVDLITVDNCVT